MEHIPHLHTPEIGAPKNLISRMSRFWLLMSMLFCSIFIIVVWILLDLPWSHKISLQLFADEIFSSRKLELESACHSEKVKEYREWEKDSKLLDHILVDDRNKLIYCYIPKVASTNWKRVLLVLAGRSNFTRLEDIPSDSVHRDIFLKLSELKPEAIAERILKFDKLIVVRHPIERIVSAFMNKFEKNYNSSAYFKSRYGVYIQKKYRPKANVSLTGDGVLFSEFVQYIIDVHEEDPRKLNEHWAPFSQLCLPCDIRYNLIGKYDTLKRDAPYILKMLKAPKNVRFPTVVASSTSSHVAKYVAMLSKFQISRIMKIYEDDFNIFDYQSNFA